MNDFLEILKDLSFIVVQIAFDGLDLVDENAFNPSFVDIPMQRLLPSGFLILCSRVDKSGCGYLHIFMFELIRFS